jgi:hypothetical protein
LPSRSGIAGLLVATGLASSVGWTAEPPPSTPLLRVEGTLPSTGSLTRAELEKLGPITVTWTTRGESRQVTGVLLGKVLQRFGWSPGPMGKDVPKAEKRSGYRKILVATARDGFQAVFSAAEVVEGMGATRALVVWAVDGKPLAPDLGPLRLVVVTDGEAARSLHQLESLRVVDLASPPAPAR